MSTLIEPNAYPNATALTQNLANATIGLASTVADPPVGLETNEVVQTTDLGNDVMIHGKITTGTGPTAGKIQIWAWGSGSDGTTRIRPALITGTAQATGSPLTLGTWWKDSGMVPLVVINTTTTANTGYTFTNLSLLKAFGAGLYLPERWGLFIFHSTVAALNVTIANHFILYTPQKTQQV